jgi:hypothetical protein
MFSLKCLLSLLALIINNPRAPNINKTSDKLMITVMPELLIFLKAALLLIALKLKNSLAVKNP